MASPYDNYFMSKAFEAASQSISTRWQIGAVFTDVTTVLAQGHNHMPLTSITSDCEVMIPCTCLNGWTSAISKCRKCNGLGYTERSNNDIIHAEISAYSDLLSKGISPNDLSLYVTHSPCINCAKFLSTLGLHEIVYSIPFTDTTGLDFLKRYHIPVRQFTLTKGTT